MDGGVDSTVPAPRPVMRPVMRPVTRPVTRIGALARDRLGPGVRGRVHSVFEHSANLDCGGPLVALLAPGLGLHPFALMPGGGLPRLARGEVFAVDAGWLRFGSGQSVRLAGAAKASLRPAPAVLPPEALRSAILEARPLLEGSVLRGVLDPQGGDADAPGLEAAGAFLRAFAAGDEGAALASGERVLGLGPGLTPAFDDFLVGAAAALAYLPRGRAGRRRRVIRGLAERAEHLTTRVSREFLGGAARNMFSEPVLAVLDALARPDAAHGRRAMRALARMGHTSGADCLAGLLGAASAFESAPRNERS